MAMIQFGKYIVTEWSMVTEKTASILHAPRYIIVDTTTSMIVGSFHHQHFAICAAKGYVKNDHIRLSEEMEKILSE
jgi:hypothetical protein